MGRMNFTGETVKFRKYQKSDISISDDILRRYPDDVVKRYVVAQCPRCRKPMKAVTFLSTGMKLGCSGCKECAFVNKNFVT